MPPSLPAADSDEDPGVMDLNGPESEIWKKEEKLILQSHLEEYKAQPKKAKKSFIAKMVLPKIKAVWGDKYSPSNCSQKKEVKSQWSKKKKSVVYWFGNQNRRTRELRIPGFNLKVTFDSVVAARKKVEIEALAKAHCPPGAGSKSWIKYYQAAKKEVKEALTAEEEEEYQQEVDDAMRKGVPKDIQRQNVTKHGLKILKTMDTLRWKSMGMRTVAFEFHYKDNGKLAYSSYDTQTLQPDAPSHIPSFAAFDPGSAKMFRESFIKYSKYVASLETAQSGPIPKNNLKSKVLPEGPTGLPLLPEYVRNVHGLETVINQQNIIRIYWNKHYNLASAGTAKYVPFTALAKNPDLYIDSKDLPEDIVFKDPSHYKLEHTYPILKLWRDRQKDGQIPFQFRGINGKNGVEMPNYPPKIFDSLHDPHKDPNPHTIHRIPRKKVPANNEEESEEEETNSKKNPSISEESEEEESLHSSSTTSTDGDIPTLERPQIVTPAGPIVPITGRWPEIRITAGDFATPTPVGAAERLTTRGTAQSHSPRGTATKMLPGGARTPAGAVICNTPGGETPGGDIGSYNLAGTVTLGTPTPSRSETPDTPARSSPTLMGSSPLKKSITTYPTPVPSEIEVPIKSRSKRGKAKAAIPEPPIPVVYEGRSGAGSRAAAARKVRTS